MKFHVFWLGVALSMSGCGVELEQGKRTMDQMQQKIDQAGQQAQQRAEQAGGDK